MFPDFKKTAAWADNLTLVMQLGLTMAGSVVLGFFVGRQLDQWLGTKSIFLIIFTVLGVIGGAYMAYKNIMAIMVPDKKKNNDHNDNHDC